MKKSRVSRRLMLACIALLAWPLAALAQNYPSKPIRLVVAYLPGGVVDSVARLIQPELTKALGQPVIIENKAGASGTIGAGEVARAAPDGYTMLMVFDSHAIAPLFTAGTPYDALKDFAPISLLVRAPMVALASTALPVTDARQLVNYAKANPDKVTYGSSGVGSSPHLMGELFDRQTGVSMTHVPYKGGAQVQTDLIGGHLDLFWAPTSSVKPLLASGKVRMLGQAATTRSRLFSDVPTLAEQGLPPITAASWIGISAPAGTPKTVIDRWYAELQRVSKIPAVANALHAQGYDIIVDSPAQFDAYIRQEFKQWKTVIEAAHMTTAH